MKKIHLLCFLTISICFESIAQNNRLITGTVTNLENGTALPFASISLKKQLIGTITNENGEFGFLIPENIVDDTLVASYLGYYDQKIFVGDIKDQLYIKLQANLFALQEVVIRPMPPTHYIKVAVNKLEENYPNAPFSTEAYYSEKIIENNRFIIHNEAVFKTYYSAYQDTISNQNQLVLFRKETKVPKVEFMSDKIKKEKEKEQKKEKKKAMKNGLEYTESEEEGEVKDVGSLLRSVFGGPGQIIDIGEMNNEEPFLDSTSFKNFHYSFSEKSTPDMMVINYKSMKVIDMMRHDGIIFIDMQTDAIVAIESYGILRIPLAIKPFLLLIGIRLDKPNFMMKKKYRQIEDKWYPDNIQLALDFTITKKYMFMKNEHSDFKFNQVFSVNKFELDNPVPIALEKKFNPENEFETQVFNDNGLSWSEINIMKKE
jgi:hypothetical protein|tara:strand:+ start:194 stop:1483 length:1290 start_codon:yes stop_codon:yes gene_type:complete